MQGNFTTGLIIGGVMGAAISMMLEPETMNKKTRRKMMRTGRNFIRRSGNIVGDVTHMFR